MSSHRIKAMKKFLVVSALAVSLAAGLVPMTSAQDDAPLVIESWRNDDLTIWQDKIIPAFNAKYPDIKVEFRPSPPADYNALLNSKLESGTAGDLITCRPFDASLTLYNNGYLAPLTDLPGMEKEGPVDKVADFLQ